MPALLRLLVGLGISGSGSCVRMLVCGLSQLVECVFEFPQIESTKERHEFRTALTSVVPKQVVQRGATFAVAVQERRGVRLQHNRQSGVRFGRHGETARRVQGQSAATVWRHHSGRSQVTESRNDAARCRLHGCAQNGMTRRVGRQFSLELGIGTVVGLERRCFKGRLPYGILVVYVAVVFVIFIHRDAVRFEIVQHMRPLDVVLLSGGGLDHFLECARCLTSRPAEARLP